MRRAGALALVPDIAMFDRDLAAEQRAFDLAAQAGLRYTPLVAQAQDHTLLLDVGASLTLFGGPHRLAWNLRHGLDQLGLHFQLGMAPTPGAASLLARQPAVTRRRTLRQAVQAHTAKRLLDKLPIDLLPSAQPHLSWLSGSGCQTLADLQRLPRAGLQQRGGTAILHELDAAYGRIADIRRGYVAPARFDYRLDLLERLEHTTAIQSLAQRLIAALCVWLAARKQAVHAFDLILEHERGRSAREPTCLTLSLAEPGWRIEHLTEPLKERLARIQLEAPVIALAITSSSLSDLPGHAGTLFPDPAITQGEHRRLLDLLAARLGTNHVLQATPSADHRPEAANTWQSALLEPPATTQPTSSLTTVPSNPGTGALDRPFWLLPQPCELPVRGERPVIDTPLRLLRGPERLESGWWDSPLTMRDYFVAENAQHVRYWIYRERDAHPARWFLHGLFA